jgi:hypothetical protein
LKPINYKQGEDKIMVRLKKESFGLLPFRQKSLSAQRGSVDVGKLIGIVIFLIILGLFGYGAWWVIKNTTDAGTQYGEAIVDTKHKAVALQCQLNLRSIWQNLRTYAFENESFPASLETFEQWGANSQLLQCPAVDKQKYAYIPGQYENSSGGNVLVYELKAAHEGRCNLLRVDGQIELLTPEEVQAEVSKTKARLRDKR